MKYVIIGNGAAGIAAAEKIRRIDFSGEITILSSEGYDVYSKCLLPDFLSGQVSEERMFIRSKDFYEKNRITVLYNYKVNQIDFKLKQIYAEYINRSAGNFGDFGISNYVCKYDKLLIATGSTQNLPPVKGLDTADPFFLSTLDEAKKIVKASKDARRILIIGAGFVGLEAAFNLYKSEREVTLIEAKPRLLEGQLDPTASSIIRDSIEEVGIRLMLNVSVTEVHSSKYADILKLFGENQANTVVLNDGRRLKADMIIVSAGSKPNIAFIKNSGLKINRGIVVDPFMQTSEPDVYAAGDVVETQDAVTGNITLSPIWPNAVIQGEAAGGNMAGKGKAFDNLVSMQNASEFREVPMITIGITTPDSPDYEELVDYRPYDKVYRKLVIKDNVLVGMIFLGDIKNAGVIGALIKQKTDVGKIKTNMLNLNFGFSEVCNLI